jgi:hypothetical protein
LCALLITLSGEITQIFLSLERVRLENGTYIVTDMFALDVGPPKTYCSVSVCVLTLKLQITFDFGNSDIELGGRQDVFSVSGEHVDGVTTCRFTRRIDSTDPYDHTIDPGLVKVPRQQHKS